MHAANGKGLFKRLRPLRSNSASETGLVSKWGTPKMGDVTLGSLYKQHQIQENFEHPENKPRLLNSF